MSVLLVWPLSYAVIHHLPDNYMWQVKQAVAKSDINTAQRIAQGRVNSEYYDFAAHRILAAVLLDEGQTTQAVNLLLDSVQRARVILGRQVFSLGLNPALTHRMLAQALKEQGRLQFASEIQRLADDEDSNLRTENTTASAEVASLTQDTGTSLAASINWIDLSRFHLAEGVSLTNENTIRFGLSGTADIIIDNASTATALVLEISGNKVMGIGGLLRIQCNNEDLIHLYGDTEEPRLITVPLLNSPTSAPLSLTLQFLNDQFEPVTHTDRNIELLRLGLSEEPVH